MQFVVTVKDRFSGHIVTVFTDTWDEAVRWARSHTEDGLAVIRDQRTGQKYWLTLSDERTIWVYA